MELIIYLIFNFILYSFLGWGIEEAYSFIITGELKKDGFLNGPFKPMYGIAFTYLILCNEVLGITGFPLVILCFLIPTTVEYISGCALKYIFDESYWDYSDFKYNLHGFITIKFSIYWTGLSYIGIHFLQPAVYTFYDKYEENLLMGTFLFLIVLIIDLFLTLQKLKEEKTFNNSNIE
ncbi:putative ABC transporter permease [Clostridium sp. C2-6-12]|uniref:putative ABC transporter permease n=1 Tax=Clostridium sp. C2-6-12 TaxID=2698832 RepID=UPI0013693158|nr:putative ABC transporter permease [Clostridium sp. C2-6-12]